MIRRTTATMGVIEVLRRTISSVGQRPGVDARAAVRGAVGYPTVRRRVPNFGLILQESAV